MIHGFHIYEFSCSLKFICRPKINTYDAFALLKRNKNIGHLTCTFPTKARQGDPVIIFCLSNYEHRSFFMATFLWFCLLLVGDFAASSGSGPEHQKPSPVSGGKKPTMPCLMERISVLDPEWTLLTVSPMSMNHSVYTARHV